MKFSVIIPMYNAGRYIETCLASVFAREGDFEVIVVDDGSDDGSAALVREKFPQVRLFEKAHAGQGAARNFGLQQAAGDYVWFVDADDTIAPEAFERLAEAAGEGPDIIALAAANLGEDGPVRRFSWKGMRPCPGREVILQGKLQRGTPFSVYRREFLRSRSLCFPEGICHEDAVFTPMAWYQAERVQFIDELLYFVFLSP
ncbi:MAG: glycosyltransferase, partial [Bacteroidales bacterium]|nr:glycosyltransferase [Bacteroidales bacterium]